MSKMSEEELRSDITSIIYGADWKERDIANAFKPDVEAAMELIHSYTQEKCREARLDEIRHLRSMGKTVKVPGFEDTPVFSDAMRERIAQLNKSKGENG